GDVDRAQSARAEHAPGDQREPEVRRGRTGLVDEAPGEASPPPAARQDLEGRGLFRDHRRRPTTTNDRGKMSSGGRPAKSGWSFVRLKASTSSGLAGSVSNDTTSRPASS